MPCASCRCRGDDLRYVVGDLRKRRWGKLGRHVGELLGELVSACPELLGLGVESGQPASKHLLIERPVLERTQVAVDGLVGLGQLSLYDRQFRALSVLARVVLLSRFGHGVGDQAVVVAVEGGQPFQDGRFESIGVEPFGVAGVGAVPGPGEAGVVPVGLGLARGARVPIMALPHFGQRSKPVRVKSEPLAARRE